MEVNEHGVNTLRKLSPKRLMFAYIRLKRIVESTKLSGYDDTTIGSKNTECTWGLCSENPKLWPDRIDHTWPHDLKRIAPLNYQGHCPMQMEKGNGSGCFWYCKFFQHKYKNPSREEYLEMIAKKLELIISEDEIREIKSKAFSMFQINWPEDSWFVYGDYDVNCWIQDGCCKITVYPIVDGKTDTSVYKEIYSE